MYSKKLDKSKKLEGFLSKNVEFLRRSNGLNLAEMAQIMGIGKSSVDNYEKGAVEPSASTVLRIVQHFGIALGDLMQKDLSKKGAITPISSADMSAVTSVVDTSGFKLIPVTDIKAAAGLGYLNQDTVEETDVIRLPPNMIRGGNHLCIRVKGISMAPTLQDGGYVIIRMLDPGGWATMSSDRIYVVVDKEGKTYLKRVKNRLVGTKGFIVMTSDSPDKMSNPSFNLNLPDIQYIWYVEWYFTAKMPNIHDQYYSRLSNLEDTVQELQHQFVDFKKKQK